jgi:ankyrin repeat protein
MDDMWIKVKYGIERATLTAAWNLGFKNKKHDYRQYTEKRFREVIVGVQAQLHSKKRSFGLYYYVKTGDLDKVQQLIARDDTLIGKRDAAGAAAFHLAYVFQHYHVGHYLVEQYPELAIEPYNGHQADEILDEFPELNNPEFTDAMMPYTGATILHIAIVRRNFEEVRWLLNYYYSHRDTVPDGLSRILSANVTGKFFAADGDFYLGGLPLHFAVCANHMGIFDIIMSYASRVRLVLPELYLIPGDESSKKSSASGAAGDDDKNDSTSGSAHVHNEVFSMSDKGGLFHLPHLLGASDKLAPTAAAHHTDAKEETKRDSSHPTGEESLSPGSLKVQSDRTKKRTIAGQNMLFLSDMQGNTVLHLCVRYGLQEMYAHIFRTAQRILTAEIKQLYAAYAHKGVGAVVRLQEIPHTPYGYTMLPKVSTRNM